MTTTEKNIKESVAYSVLENMDNSLTRDREFMNFLLEERGYGLKYATSEQQNSKELILKVIEKDHKSLKYVSERLKDDKEVVAIAIESEYLIREQYLSSNSVFEYASDRIKRDKAFVLEMFQYRDIWEYLDESFQKDESFVAFTLKMGHGWEYATQTQRDNIELVLSSISKDGKTLSYASERLRDDREIVESAINNNPDAYEYASERLRDIKEIGKNALEKSSSVYKFMGESLKRDRELALIYARSTFWISLGRLDKNFRADREIMLVAIEQYKEGVRYADESLKEDKSFILEALRVNPDVYDELWKINVEWEEDEEVLALVG